MIRILIVEDQDMVRRYAAKVLGVGRRTITGYLKKDRLPPMVAIACRALARDRHILAAHYVPARKVSRRAA